MERDGSLPEISFAEDSKAAATVFEIVVMLFMFLGLAIVCDEYFEAALEAICEAQGLQDDVAGATWMAAGGSAPELATSLVGTLISFSDVGFGTIVGSAVFNVLFVIACCAFVAPNLKLQWYPLARDATCYCFAILWLVIFTGDARVHWWEALLLFALYIGYVTIMKYNVQIETWVNYRIELTKQPRNRWQSFICWSIKQNWFHLLMYIAIFSNTIIIALDLARGSDEVKDGEDYFCFIRCVHDEKEDIFYLVANTCFSFFFIAEMLYKWAGFGFFGYWRDFWNYCDGVLVCLIIVEWITYSVASNAPGGIGAVRALRVTRFLRAARMIRVVRLYGIFSRRLKEATTQVVPADWKEGDAVPAKNEPAENGVREMPQINSYDSPKKPPKSSQVAPEKGAEKAYGDAKPDDKDAGDDDDGDDDDDGPSNPFEIPDSPVGKFFWALGLPLSLLFFVTIPDCRRPMFKRLYMLTFAMSIFWIGALAFVMVWMATEFGIQYELPASVMGITILAAGTSIPDCLSSIAVARRGHGDMAVSSSIGSNIFDILVGLPIPWFIYGAIFQPLSGKGPQDYVEIDSDGLTIMVRARQHCRRPCRPSHPSAHPSYPLSPCHSTIPSRTPPSLVDCPHQSSASLLRL